VNARAPAQTSLSELARVFLKLGAISVGGPAAHVALMRHEFVDRRRWLTNEAFLDLVGATNLIPGPNSTELAIHIGLARAGWRGLIIAGACFILPAVAIVGAVAAVYVRVGALPQTQALFYGVKPVVVAIIAVAIWQLGRVAIRSGAHAAAAVAAIAGAAAGVHELTLLGLAGVIGGALGSFARGRRRLSGVAMLPGSFLLQGAATGAATVTSGTLFLVFLKAGAFLFGSGYVLLAFLRADLVQRLGWLSEQQLLDAIAIGQFTPGPVFTTATFIGYVLHGSSGAAIATIAIFLPAFIYVAASGPLVPRLRASPIAGGVLDGVNLASLALMTWVTWEIGRASVIDLPTGALAIASLTAMVVWRVNPAWLMLGGAVIGLLAKRL
jgi:chromate transporter